VHRRLRPFLLVMALFALAVPATTLADVPMGAWQITGIVLDGTKIDASGKLSLDTQVNASVGCNSIGGQVTSIDANTITVGALSSTLIGCPADLANAESALTQILTAGPITMSADKWESAAGQIDLIDATGANSGGGAPGCIPPIAPGANPGNVTVPCGNGDGNVGVLSTIGTPVAGPPPPDPLTIAGFIGVGVLLVATIAAFVYLGPRRRPGGGTEE
jgi:hypothetical protein